MVLALAALAAVAPAGERVTRIGGPPKKSRVPAWDARGMGPLPWQGVACADLSDNGRYAALGTIAPPGDPHVFIVAENGRLVGQHSAGRRWINEVAVTDDGFAAAICSTPTGQAGDRPMICTFPGGPGEAIDPMVFHYADHSNHLSPCLKASGGVIALMWQGSVRWLTREADLKRLAGVSVRGGEEAIAFAIAPRDDAGPMLNPPAGTKANDALRVAVGLAASAPDGPNLFVIERGKPQPLFSRDVATGTDRPPRLEPGEYGPPAPSYVETEAWAPLSVAISRAGTRVAAADYQGWERRFGPQRAMQMGRRFMPARPAITVYDDQGKPIRQFAQATFAKPFWADLAFSPDGARLYAWPHSWPARALAGQTLLPADHSATRVYALDVESGAAEAIEFPDAVSAAAVRHDGGLAVGCWNGRVYLLGKDLRPLPGLPDGIDVGAPCLIDVSRDGSRILVATTDGIARMHDGSGQELWRLDLNKAAAPGDKPWTRNQRPGSPTPGVWRTNGNLAHSDMGGQYLVEAPDGLVLIDPSGGLSFEQNWARIQGAGFDPMRVKYVLLTHEHGDHAPGAYLWRVITGAQVVASAEVAYGMQHHLPFVSGYGFHPPNPVDVRITDDRDLDLAGLKVRAARLAGHTWGSMGYAFQVGGKKCVAIGDVIMPGGTLGYSGSLTFFAQDVMASMHKLASMKPDVILGGHGEGDPANFAGKGIEVGEATGWAKMEPVKPDPFYAISRRNYLIIAWRQPIASAVYPDVNGDGRPDVAVTCGQAVNIFLNRNGTFGNEPDCRISTPVSGRLRSADINQDGTPDFFVCGGSEVAVLMSQGGKPDYAVGTVECHAPIHVLPADVNGDGRLDLVMGSRFAGAYTIAEQRADGTFARPRQAPLTSVYFDFQLIDVNGDKRDDIVASNGDVVLRQADGSFMKEPAVRLQAFGQWTFMAAADFNKDGRVEVTLMAGAEDGSTISVRFFENTGDAARPLAAKPSREFTVSGASMLRDGPTVADWNGDGTPDLVLPAKGREGAVVLLGGPDGLNPDRTDRVPFDYVAHYDTRLGVADFNGDGLPDIAGFGPTRVGVPAVYVWLKEKSKNDSGR